MMPSLIDPRHLDGGDVDLLRRPIVPLIGLPARIFFS